MPLPPRPRPRAPLRPEGKSREHSAMSTLMAKTRALFRNPWASMAPEEWASLNVKLQKCSTHLILLILSSLLRTRVTLDNNSRLSNSKGVFQH